MPQKAHLNSSKRDAQKKAFFGPKNGKFLIGVLDWPGASKTLISNSQKAAQGNGAKSKVQLRLRGGSIEHGLVGSKVGQRVPRTRSCSSIVSSGSGWLHALMCSNSKPSKKA